MSQTDPSLFGGIFSALGAGLPHLLLQFAVAVAMLAAGVAIYMAVTPFRERQMIEEGNTAAGVVLGGAIVADMYGPRVVFLILGVAACIAPLFTLRLPSVPEAFHPQGPRFAWPSSLNLWSFAQGLTLDGIFVFGLSLLAASHLPKGAVIAAGTALALRYAVEIVFSPVGGQLAQRHGARRMVVMLSLASSASLALLGAQGAILWVGNIATIVLRALMQPLPGPVVAETFGQDARVGALAAQATWRDIGAGAGPLVAGFLLPIAAPVLIYGASAALLAATSTMLSREQQAPRT